MGCNPPTYQRPWPDLPLNRTTNVSTSGSVKTQLNQEPLPDFWISLSMEHPAFARSRPFHASMKQEERILGQKYRRRQKIVLRHVAFTLQAICEDVLLWVALWMGGRCSHAQTAGISQSHYNNKQDYLLSLTL